MQASTATGARARRPARVAWVAAGLALAAAYGREVGGLPFFNAGSVTPAGTATSVTLRAAYSEARRHLWTAGGSTLSLPAAAGDTNLKLGADRLRSLGPANLTTL